MKMENMKKINGYDNYYASNDGHIYNIKTGRQLRPCTSQCGYHYVTLSKKGICRTYTVHRLVWTAFNGDIPKDMEINHIDDVKTNNNLANLEIVTHKYNCNYGARNDKLKKPITLTYCGLDIEFPSITDVAICFSTSAQSVYSKIYYAKKTGKNTIVIDDRTVEFTFMPKNK